VENRKRRRCDTFRITSSGSSNGRHGQGPCQTSLRLHRPGRLIGSDVWEHRAGDRRALGRSRGVTGGSPLGCRARAGSSPHVGTPFSPPLQSPARGSHLRQGNNPCPCRFGLRDAACAQRCFSAGSSLLHRRQCSGVGSRNGQRGSVGDWDRRLRAGRFRRGCRTANEHHRRNSFEFRVSSFEWVKANRNTNPESRSAHDRPLPLSRGVDLCRGNSPCRPWACRSCRGRCVWPACPTSCHRRGTAQPHPPHADAPGGARARPRCIR